jgi:uncharacterized protein with ParB-like and HNH nuclease domain
MSLFKVETVSLLDFLRSMSTRLIVPDYQRGYSWEKTQLDELILDVKQITENEYLIGSMIFIRRSDNALEVVDGQQRLTTFFILLSALHDRLNAYSQDNVRAENEKDRIKGALYDIDNAGSRIYKLELGGFDKNYFKSVICENLDIEPNKIYHSNKLLYQVKKAIQQEILSIETKEGLSGLLNFVDKLKKITLISIYVGNEGDAYTIFESINDRGAGLTVADLLKNFLLKIAHSRNDDPDRVKENWENIITTLGELKVTDLLTYYWRAKKDNVTSARLFKAIKEHIEEESYSPKKFTDELVKAAESYRKIEHPEEFGIHPKLQDALNGIRATGFKQWYPLIMAALMHDIQRDQLLKLFNSIESLSVYLKVDGFNPSALEAKYVNWANRMLVDGELQVDPIIQDMAAEYPSFKSFCTKFKEVSFDTNLAKLVLIRCEQVRGFGDNNLDFESYELEHILPKRLGNEWDYISTEQHDEYLNDIGNLTLLAKEQNIRGSNKSFEIKKNEYLNSRIRMTQEIGELEQTTWTPSDIEQRAKTILDEITSVWKHPKS